MEIPPHAKEKGVPNAAAQRAPSATCNLSRARGYDSFAVASTYDDITAVGEWPLLK